MRKHPVDDLFAQKLNDWQPKVSPDLWKRIDNSQENKTRRLAAWHWYAAAGVALVLLAGYVVWQSQFKALSGKSQELAKVDQLQQSGVNSSGSGDSSRESLRRSAAEAEENEKLVEITGLPNYTPQEETTTEPTIQPRVAERDPASSHMEIAAIPKSETSPESLISDNKPPAGLPSVEVRPETQVGNLPDQGEGRVIIAHIETESESQDDHKDSKLIRILRQLKNAKQGEAIEWEEVGLNPRKLLARADERLKNEEEKVSKKYQELKDKTKL